MLPKKYLVTKHFEPEGFYADSLAVLPGAERNLTPGLPNLIIKERLMPPDQARTIRQREHIASVEEVTEVYQQGNAIEEEVGLSNDIITPQAASIQSTTVPLRRTMDLHRLAELHVKGFRGAGETIAILDTGVSESLAAHLGERLIHKSSKVSGEDWRDTKSMHGTWCISCIHNYAPEAKIISIKVLSTETGSGTTSGIIAAIDEAYRLGATVVSMSLGGKGSPTDSMASAVNSARQRGVLLPCAAGNEQRGTTEHRANTSSPGCADGAICTGAADSDFAMASFSNMGGVVDVAAQGVLITETPFTSGSWSGTSMATPCVSGILGCLGSATNADPNVVENSLRSGARDTSHPAINEGHGMADAAGALAKLGNLAPAPTPEPTPPPKPEPPKRVPLWKSYGYINDQGNWIKGETGPARLYLQPKPDGSVVALEWNTEIYE